MRALPIAAAALLLCACADQRFGITVTPPPPEVIEPTPDRIGGEAPPKLRATDAQSLKAAEDERASDWYYHVAQDRWYRFALNRWYVAFTWDGAWFPIHADELPEAVRARTPTREELVERRATPEQELEDLERQLQEIEERERTGGAAPPDASP